MGSCVSKSGARGRTGSGVASPEAATRRTSASSPGRTSTSSPGQALRPRGDILTELTYAEPKVYVPALDGPLAMREEARCVPWHEFELFRELHPRNMAALVDRMTIRTFEKDELIVRKGTIGTTMYFLDQGSAEARVDNKVLEVLLPGDFFGEMAFIATCNKFLRNVPEHLVREQGETVKRSCDVKAVTTTRVVELSVHTFLTVLKDDLVGNREVLHALSTLAPIAEARRDEVKRALHARPQPDLVSRPCPPPEEDGAGREASQGSHGAAGTDSVSVWDASLIGSFFKGGDQIDFGRALSSELGVLQTPKEHILQELMPAHDAPPYVSPKAKAASMFRDDFAISIRSSGGPDDEVRASSLKPMPRRSSSHEKTPAPDESRSLVLASPPNMTSLRKLPPPVDVPRSLCEPVVEGGEDGE